MRRSYTSWRQDAAWLNQAEAWPASLFPAADYHYFRDCGCLVCALAVMLRHYDVETESDETLFNPWILNQRLIDCDAFSCEADLELEYISRLYPLEYLGAIPYSMDNLMNTIKSGYPCLVTVPGKKADRHFATVLSALDKDAIVYDPLCGETKLSSYNRLCEIRAFRLAAKD